jgi:hypothetical protein
MFSSISLTICRQDKRLECQMGSASDCVLRRRWTDYVLLVQPEFPVQRSLIYFSNILIELLCRTGLGCCAPCWAQAAVMGRALDLPGRGAGLNVEKANRNGSLRGLVSMQERVHLVHSLLEIESSPGAGTRIAASVLLAADNTEAAADTEAKTPASRTEAA